jgi:hypothetical protein
MTLKEIVTKMMEAVGPSENKVISLDFSKISDLQVEFPIENSKKVIITLEIL